MKKINAVIFLLIALIPFFAAGCGSPDPYVAPAQGEARAYATIVNNCDFTLYVLIDSLDGGSIAEGASKTFEVTPAIHNFTLSGTHTPVVGGDSFPVFFKTNHTFTTGETYQLPVDFGVD